MGLSARNPPSAQLVPRAMLSLLLACGTPAAAPDPTPSSPEAAVYLPTPTPAAPTWPAAGAPLQVLPPLSAGARPVRLVIDAGHGAPGNSGNTSVRCEAEADFTRRVQDELLARLANAPELEVRSGRPSAALLDYGSRIAAFNAWPADAVVSLHSDARAADNLSIHPSTGCWSSTGASGFTVLFSDEGPPDLARARRQLAEAMSRELHGAGFVPYAAGYSEELYGSIGAGVYVDRHPVGKRIRMLRGTKVPTVIVETHQASDAEETARWAEPATLDAFAAAIRRAAVAAAVEGPHG
ncbi:hypothetical protein LBMAG42_15890 [Deltaproteobacteria bacterium]|nr:hypothetical protein LBMAG42_15890 [Deltaproteobacteria bacterium]